MIERNGKRARSRIMIMICYGEDIEDVFDKCGVMEKAAEEYIENRWKK